MDAVDGQESRVRFCRAAGRGTLQKRSRLFSAVILPSHEVSAKLPTPCRRPRWIALPGPIVSPDRAGQLTY